MIRPLALITALALATPAAAQPWAASPEKLVAAIYAKYRPGGMGFGEEGFPAFLTPATRALFERALVRDADVVTIEADPFCDCQDFDEIVVQRTAFTAAGANRTTATIRIVDRAMGGDAKTIELHLRRTPQGWRVEDAGPLGGWRFVAQLKTTQEKRP